MPGKWFKANNSFQFDRAYIEQINDILLEENYIQGIINQKTDRKGLLIY